MNLIKQKTNYDCALACLAMASGKKYDDIFDTEFCKRIEKATTCTGDDLEEAYSRAGFYRDKNRKNIYVLGSPISLVKQLIWGRKAMLQVPSLNYENSEHFIFWDGINLFDPSTKQTYNYLQNVIITRVTIFKEC